MAQGDRLVVFHGNSVPLLAQGICSALGTEPGQIEVNRFPDGEVMVRLDQDVRGKDVFIVQSTCPPVNENIMEMLVMIDAVKRGSAGRITAVIPYFGYARQDRRDAGQRVPISAKLVANLISAAGADRVLTMDLHAEQIQGFFDIPVDHIYAGPVFTEFFLEKNIPDLVVVSPDVGSIRMARAYSKLLKARLATVDKRRISADEIEVGFVIGDVEGYNVLIADDVIATGGSIVKAATILKEKGALEVNIAATHGIFCGPAIERLESGPINGIYVTDTIPLMNKDVGGRVQVLTTAKLFAQQIEQINASSPMQRNHQ